MLNSPTGHLAVDVYIFILLLLITYFLYPQAGPQLIGVIHWKFSFFSDPAFLWNAVVFHEFLLFEIEALIDAQKNPPWVLAVVLPDPFGNSKPVSSYSSW